MVLVRSLFRSSSASYSEWSSELARHIKSSKGNEHEPACYLTLNAQPPPAPRVKKQPPALPPNHRPELRDFGGVTQPQASRVCVRVAVFC